MKSIFKNTIVIYLLTCIMFCISVFAQDDLEIDKKPYIIGIGVRAGNQSGLSIKQFVNNTTAFEGILSRDRYYNATRITILYEIQNRFKNAKGLSWFWGIGAHVSFYRPSYSYASANEGYFDNKGKWHDLDYRVNYSSAGFDGIIGLEYQFNKLPFTCGIDAKPYVNLITLPGSILNGAITVRYIIK